MNSTTRPPVWRIAVAAFALAMLGGCGADTANAPADIKPPSLDEPPATGVPQGGLARPGSGPEGWN